MVQAAAVVPAKARERLDIEWMDDDGGQIYSIDGPDDDSGRSILLMVHFTFNSSVLNHLVVVFPGIPSGGFCLVCPQKRLKFF